MAKDINLLQGSEPSPTRPETKRIGSMDIAPATIANRHLVSNLYGVLVDTERPTTGNEFPVHVNPTTGVLSVWTGSAWLTTTLT